ncbi:hypothetical protein RUND412_003305 [Rhizina undulata]
MNNAVLRWSPHSTGDTQRFLKLNSRENELCLYQVTGTKGKELQAEVVAKHTRIPYIRCMDWSPVEEDLITIGQFSGEALLVRLSQTNYTTNITIPLSVKQQRSCNGISFNSTGTLIATGLDKVRSDFCLNIWDINQRIGQSSQDISRPVRQLASSEAITSVKFFRDQPNTLVAGVGYRWIRAFDLRESPSNPAISCPTRCVHGIALDLDPNYFASYSDDGVVSVWDRRNNRSSASSDPSLYFSRATDDTHPGRASTQILELRYSRAREGVFGVLNAAGGMRIYETGKISDQDPPPPSSIGILASTESYHKPRSGWRDSAASFLSESRSLNGTPLGTRTPSYRGDGETLFVKRLNDVSTGARKSRLDRMITSFDWILGGDSGERQMLRAAVMRSDGSIGVEVSPGLATGLAWGSRGGLVLTSGRDLGILPTPAVGNESKTEVGKELERERDDETLRAPVWIRRERTVNKGEDGENGEERELRNPTEVLKEDVGVVMRARVEQGYEMDCAKNVTLVDDPDLKEMWTWLAGAYEAAKDNGMVEGMVDLTYLGVYGIWNGGRVPTPQSRQTTPRKPSQDDWTAAIKELNKAANREPFTGTTEYPEQRRMALSIAGWEFSAEGDFEKEYARLEDAREYSKAAGWALFHGNLDHTIQALSKGDQQLKLMSTVVAGYRFSLNSTESGSVDSWRKMCRERAKELEDPYLRSIFAFVAAGDWKDVLADSNLPVKALLGIALKWLPDDALTEYLEELTNLVVKEGDVRGIVATGVGEKMVELLQGYVNRTGDVQTAALVAGFVVPRYFEDERVEYWIESYRGLLNSWRLWHWRCRFDCERGRMSRNRLGERTVEPVQRQVYVRCANCDRSVSHTFIHPPMNYKDPKKQSKIPVGAITTKATVCPHCKKSLPRCAVCLLNLGTPYSKPKDSEFGSEEGYERCAGLSVSL